MAITYLEISYPNFALGAIIDPEEANQNNYEIVNKINDNINLSNTSEENINKLFSIKSDITYVDNKISNLAGTGRTTQTIKSNYDNLINHKTSPDHDHRYYTKTLLDGGQLDNRYYTEKEIDTKINTLNSKDDSIINMINNHKTSIDHDNRYYSKTQLDAGQLNRLYYTKEELIPWLRGGDTNRIEEVYTIVTSNNGDGTFNYTDGTNAYIGEIDMNGYQIFKLKDGIYEMGTNRVEIIINDTIRRSAKSGGLVEISPSEVALSSPEGNGVEVTIIYYERLGMAAEYNIKISKEKPPKNFGKNLWFDEIE